MCNFEWIYLQFKAIFRRLGRAKSREINAEMQVNTKLNLKVNLCGADFSFCLECVSKFGKMHFRRLNLHFCVDFP